MREATLARLRAEGDEYSRAVATWLESDDDAVLVDAALVTHDAGVYALALRTCRRQDGVPGSACSLLSAEQWARLDPGNAAPWLFVLDGAAARKDTAGFEEALFRIGRSERSATSLHRPVLPVLDAAPTDDASLLAAHALAVQVIGKSLAMPLPAFSPLVNACRGAAIYDANRRQLCERVADVLSEHSDDLVSRLIGGRMIANLTGSADRLALHRAELDAWTASRFPAGTLVEALGCKSLRRDLDGLREQALYGEVGAVARWVERSGLTSKVLIERARTERDRRAAAASAAAPQDASASEVPKSAASAPAEPPTR